MMGEEILKALYTVALPVGVLSFLLFRWSVKSGRLSTGSDSRALKEELKAMKRGRKNNKTRSKNPLHNKWMRFGGGFYGAVGLYTFFLIEGREVIDLAQGYEGMDAMMASVGNASFADLLVQFFVNSLKNFISAVAWPGYWAPGLSGNAILVWFALTYGAYWLGMKLARKTAPIRERISE